MTITKKLTQTLLTLVLLLAFSLSSANPPLYPKHFRFNDTFATGYGQDGSRQVEMFVGISHGLEGGYKSSSIGVSEFILDFQTDGWTETNRSLFCEVERSAITAARLWIYAEAELDSASTDCSNYGWTCTYYYDWTPPDCQYNGGYSGIVRVAGYWDYASIRSEGVINRRWLFNTTGQRSVSSCQELYAEGMRVGGIFIDGYYMPFTGLDGNTQSSYLYYKCNDTAP